MKHFFSGRFYRRPWRRSVAAHWLITGIIGALLITFYCGNKLSIFTGMLNGMIIASFAAALFLLAGAFLIPPAGDGAAKIGFRKIRRKDLGLCLGALLLALIGSALISGCWQMTLDFFHIPYEKEQTLLQLVRGSDTLSLLKILLLTAAAVPLVEELVFRRCLYELLLKLGAPAAMTGGAMIFAAAHGFLAGLPGLFFIGLVFQALCNVTRNLWCSVICHALLNATVVLLAFFFSSPSL